MSAFSRPNAYNTRVKPPNTPTDALPIVNIAAYHFAALLHLPRQRALLVEFCRARQLRGTILLSPEGINLFVAGMAQAIDELLTELRRIPGLESLRAKYSYTSEQPFKRMLVRLKREIIAFGVPGIDPAKRTSPKLTPAQLKAWLDEGRKITLLDTRNDYEIKLGTFKNAVAVGVNHFRDFPQAVARLSPQLKDETIVMFCTGGIRCEKAGPYMESQGFRHVLQLEGGILKYFEDCGSAHYQGDCFVFDQRVGVDPSLQRTDATLCFACLAPLTATEQHDPRYVYGKSCPHCYRSDAKQAQLISRNQALRAAMSPLPGSQPADIYRPLRIPQTCDGLTVLEAFERLLAHKPDGYWEEQCRHGLIVNSNHNTLHAHSRVHAGERLLHRHVQLVEPDVASDLDVLYEDATLIVLNKPAPLPMHAGGRFTRNTVQHVLDMVYRPQKPKPVHRLDANTTGIVIFARTRDGARALQQQFIHGRVNKVYVVRVQGHPPRDDYRCEAPISKTPGLSGTRAVDMHNGDTAITQFKVIERSANGTSLLEARPLTGRTNQIRIHCAFLGFPVLNDDVYSDAAPAPHHTKSIDEPPLCLHAWTIGFTHPASGEYVSFTAPMPEWAKHQNDKPT